MADQEAVIRAYEDEEERREEEFIMGGMASKDPWRMRQTMYHQKFRKQKLRFKAAHNQLGAFRYPPQAAAIC